MISVRIRLVPHMKLGDIKENKHCNKLIWHACIDCGKERWVKLAKGKPERLKCMSCASHFRTHGGAAGGKSRLYNLWHDMKARCDNPRRENYKYYGGRGIRVCSEWNNFVSFRDWALSSGYADNLTIDRINNNGDYEPSNCQWISQSENSKKRSL